MSACHNKRMSQRNVDGKPFSTAASVTGRLQGVPHCLLAGRPAQGSLGRLPPQEPGLARGATSLRELRGAPCLPCRNWYLILSSLRRTCSRGHESAFAGNQAAARGARRHRLAV
jgi:hypothetical protein